jgi:hypothetical protein
MDGICEDFDRLSPYWNKYIVGSATLEPTGSTLRFVNTDTTLRQVANAQIDDYQTLTRRQFPWRPPLRMAVRARFSHGIGQLSGTAGFGFWNDPFMMTGKRQPTLPRAIWFFYASPPSDLKLDLHTPGYGWKVATIDAARWSTLFLVPTAPLAALLMNLRPIYRSLWPTIQRSLAIQEALLDVDLTEWHTYELEWDVLSARFHVDGETVLAGAASPRGPLGFVMWLDNQYMVITPWGRFRYGRLAAPGQQWMEVDKLSIGA